MNPLVFFGLVLQASFFATTGTGNVPVLHEELLARGWATERQFAQALTVGQVAPGPSGLWVVSLGYLVGGLRGALLALVASVLPPLLVLVIDRLYRRVHDHPLVEGFMHGLSLASIGIFVVVLLELLRGAGPLRQSLLLALVSLGLAATRRVPVFMVLALAGLAGVVLQKIW